MRMLERSDQVGCDGFRFNQRQFLVPNADSEGDWVLSILTELNTSSVTSGFDGEQ